MFLVALACCHAPAARDAAPVLVVPANVAAAPLDVIDAGPPAAAPPSERLLSYEEALDTWEPAGKEPSTLKDSELSAPLRSATFLSECGAPETMKVTVKIAVVDGKALGVTVLTKPEDAKVASCVDKRVRSLTWPASTAMDSFTTIY